MSDTISLTGLRVVARHGVLPAEKAEPQPFLADLELTVDLGAIADSDDLSRTVSYAEVAQETEVILAGPPVDLIETLAERIAAAALRRVAVEAVQVRIRKPQAPAGVDFAGVDADAVGPAVTVRREQDRPVVVALGANLGRREQTLAAAVDALAATEGIRVTAVSDLVETDPVGGPDQPDYLNAVLVGRSRLAPWTLLALLHRIEAEHGRTRDVRWGARSLDLDLIAVGAPGTPQELTSDTDALTLPHPRAQDRAFVLVPWLQADPAARVSVGGTVVPLEERVAELGEAGVRSGPSWPSRSGGRR